jgi:general L-amino acid transport system substrate-binding protein
MSHRSPHTLRYKGFRLFQGHMSKLKILIFCSCLFLLCITSQLPLYSQTQPLITRGENSRLDNVISRGRLTCGVEGSIPGFSFVDSQKRYSGLDVDICRAIAAAIFADPNRVDFRNLDSTERFPALAQGEVDLLSRNSSWTASRDATGGNGFDFAPPVLFDGQGIMVRKNSGLNQLKDLQGKTVCVEMDTILEVNLAKMARSAGIALNLRKVQNSRQNFADYGNGQCDAITADRSQLAVVRLSLPNPDENRVWDVLLSMDTLAPLTVDNDAQWSDVVHWVIYGLIKAEELNINQANVQANVGSNDPETSLFLGGQGGVGTKLGLSDDFMVNAIRAVGNYGEIYDRNFGSRSSINLPRGVNNIWSKGGLMYAPSWR